METLAVSHDIAVSGTARRLLLSIVTPAFNEAENLPVLYQRLCRTMQSIGMDWEWIIVDDHSDDPTFGVISGLAKQDCRIKGVRFARNFGAHTALACGLHRSQGDCVVAVAADLQDPPEAIPALLAQWRENIEVVWAVRHHREGETAATIGFSRLYYWLMRHLVGMKDASHWS